MRLPMLAALAAAVSAGIPCTSDGDCTANEFCRATYSATNECLFNTLECTARGGVGTYCGGLVSPCNANRCLPGMVCQPQLPLIPDQPGICQWKPCTKDAKVCPDGTVVGRDPANNCEFFPCKDCSLVRCLLPVCKDGSTPVILEGDCCPTCRKQCKLSDGTLVPHGWSGQGAGDNWCNSCSCADGALACTRASCDLKCCDPAKKTQAACREGCICCGATGEWVGSIGDGKTFTCAGVTHSGPKYPAPFGVPCPCTKDAKVCPDGTVVGRDPENNCEFFPCKDCSKVLCIKPVCKDGSTPVIPEGECCPTCRKQCKLSDGTLVPHGWSGQGVGSNWCNSCTCEEGTLSCTELDCTLKCCDPAEKTLARCREGCICCGATGEWVGSIGDARTYTCAGVTQSGPDYTAPFYKPCDQCKLPDGTVVAEGWTGQGTGDNWCNKCWCRDGQYGCTKKACTTKCCDPADKTKAVCREGCICCGATGTWVGSHGDGKTFTCAGVTQSGPTYTSPFDKPCPQCKLPDGTVVAEGWTGQGTGDNWCNKCWCKDGQYGCTKKECPECRTDVKKCPDGTIVHRDPLNDCLFPKCPLPCDVTCGGKMGLVCALGFSCIDIATDDCDPQNGGADCLGCCERVICFDDAKICRDGSLVYRDPTNGCKFHPCPVDV